MASTSSYGSSLRIADPTTQNPGKRIYICGSECGLPANITFAPIGIVANSAASGVTVTDDMVQVQGVLLSMGNSPEYNDFLADTYDLRLYRKEPLAFAWIDMGDARTTARGIQILGA